MYISRLCYDVSVCPSVRLCVTEVHCGHGACREEGRGHLALATARPSCSVVSEREQTDPQTDRQTETVTDAAENHLHALATAGVVQYRETGLESCMRSTVRLLSGPAPFQTSGLRLFQSRAAAFTTTSSGSTSRNPVMLTPPYRKLPMSSSSID